MPVNSSTAPAIRPMVPAFWTRPSMFSWSEMPGTWSASLSSSLSCCSWLSVAAATAADTVSSGKSATKLVNVIAAASWVHFTRSMRSNERHACVVVSRVNNGPTPGSFFSQSMIRLCPPSGRPMSVCPKTAAP